MPASPIVRSAVWAAWADALGFQTELAEDERALQRRLGAESVQTTFAWHRRIGGRFGVQVQLPAGAYSDDTQLRLAVCRCIRADGRFDIETFSKIELPLFPSYELGGGLGTKAAAHALGRKATRWNSNFFASKRSRYVEGGGNGAAMRVQPHVWASKDLRPGGYLPGVLRDAVCTHGHPRAILGAVLHALALASVLRERMPPEPARWDGMAKYLAEIPALMSDDEDLAERWLPLWEQKAGQTFSSAAEEVVLELRAQLRLAAQLANKRSGQDLDLYGQLAEGIGGLSRATRGSGAVSAVLALWLAWRFPDRAAEGARVAANLIGSDTDTVATMAAALAGPMTSDRLPGPLLDAELHIAQAQRLEAIAARRPVEDFPHPDPLRWRAPQAMGDFLGLLDSRPVVAGLGFVELEGDLFSPGGRKEGGWQWARTSFGQHLLVKRRETLPVLGSWAAPRQRAIAVRSAAPQPVPNGALLANGRLERLPGTVDDALEQLAARGYEHLLFSRLFMNLARGEHGSARAGVFATLVAERIRAREGLSSELKPHPVERNRP